MNYQMKANENHLKTKNENPTGKQPIKKEERKMKKTIIATLMAGTLVLGMTACGTKPTETTVAPTTTTTVEETTVETTAETTPAETTVETTAETTAQPPMPADIADMSEEEVVERLVAASASKTEEEFLANFSNSYTKGDDGVCTFEGVSGNYYIESVQYGTTWVNYTIKTKDSTVANNLYNNIIEYYKTFGDVTVDDKFAPSLVSAWGEATPSVPCYLTMSNTNNTYTIGFSVPVV